MKKRFKKLDRKGKILILRWEADGKLFGPDWDCIAVFDSVEDNRERVKTIVRLMNECDTHTERKDNDRTRAAKDRRGLH